MAISTRVAGNKEGGADEEGNGDSDKGPTAQSCATAKQQSTSGWQGVGRNGWGKA